MTDPKLEDLNYKNRTEESDFTDKLQSNGFKFDGNAKGVGTSKKDRLYCDICKILFNNIIESKEHMKEFNNVRLLECMQCSTAVNSKHNLLKHTQAHTGCFTCIFCKMDFSSINDMTIHNLRNHAEESLLPRKNLQRAVKEKQDLPKATPKGKGRYICHLCDIIFENRDEFLQHKLTANEKKPLNCVQCGEATLTYHGLMNHILIHTGKLNCTICKSDFGNRKLFIAHCETHAGKGPFPCGDCKRTFIFVKNLAMHRLTHLDFIGKAALRAKKQAIWSPEDRREICNICNIEFEKFLGYRVHKHIYDEKILCYCPRCGEIFSSRHDYVNHSHVGDFTCPVCKRDFVSKKGFIDHKKQKHNKYEIKFACKNCCLTFSDVEMLIKHIFDEHLEDSEKFIKPLNRGDILTHNRRTLMRKDAYGKPIYLCHLCNKTYSDRDYDFHKEKHMGVVWYLCGKCDQFFGDQKSCKSHRKTAHAK